MLLGGILRAFSKLTELMQANTLLGYLILLAITLLFLIFAIAKAFNRHTAFGILKIGGKADGNAP